MIKIYKFTCIMAVSILLSCSSVITGVKITNYECHISDQREVVIKFTIKNNTKENLGLMNSKTNSQVPYFNIRREGIILNIRAFAHPFSLFTIYESIPQSIEIISVGESLSLNYTVPLTRTNMPYVENQEVETREINHAELKLGFILLGNQVLDKFTRIPLLVNNQSKNQKVHTFEFPCTVRFSNQGR